MKKVFIILVLLALGTLIFGAPLKVAVGTDKPPYVWNDNGVMRGMEHDIATEILKSKGYTFEVTSMPNNRKDRSIQDGYDVAVQMRKTDDPNIYYSDEFITYQNFAFSKKSSNLKIDKLSDLTKYTLVAFQGAPTLLGGEFLKLFGPDAPAENKKNYSEQPNQSSQNKVFWADRAQVVVLERNIFEWYRLQYSKEYNTKGEVVYHDVFKTKTIYYVAFKDKKVRDDFNDGLAKLIKSGRYQQIIDSYLK